MRILLQTGDDFIFLAGDGRLGERVFSSAEGFELAGELETQIVRKVRGSHARAINRGNVKHRAFFRTRRLFPTPAEAEEFVANAERSFPRSGTLYFITGGGTRKLLQAVVTPPASSVQGCEARLQYQAAGGEFSPHEPELVIDGLEQIHYRIVQDESGKWFECGFDSPYLLEGNAADGWTDPFGQFLLRFQRSETLTTWDYQWTDAPGSPELAGDTYTYWARALVPLLWKYVTIDETATTARYGKSITGIDLFGTTLALPGYPYAMPAAAATLQADLRTLGYTGATVTSTSAALTADVKRHMQSSELGYIVLQYAVTMSGTNVTEVRTDDGTPITLPGYPYAMPAAAATLQADLVTAGHSGAVVRLFADEWSVFIPNLTTVLNARQFNITFTPSDPFPRWNMFGDYEGLVPDNTVQGTFSNLRATAGLAPLQEALKQFARLGVSPGPNYLY